MKFCFNPGCFIDSFLIKYISDFDLYLGIVSVVWKEIQSAWKCNILGETAFSVIVRWIDCHQGFEFDI